MPPTTAIEKNNVCTQASKVPALPSIDGTRVARYMNATLMSSFQIRSPAGSKPVAIAANSCRKPKPKAMARSCTDCCITVTMKRRNQ